MYVTYIFDIPAISDPRVPASHTHMARLGLDGTCCKECLVGDDLLPLDETSYFILLYTSVFKVVYILASSQV